MYKRFKVSPLQQIMDRQIRIATVPANITFKAPAIHELRRLGVGLYTDATRGIVMQFNPQIASSTGRYGRTGFSAAAVVRAAFLAVWQITAAAAVDTSSYTESPHVLSALMRDGLLSLNSVQRPWEDVLSAIEQATRLQIHHRPTLRGLVSVSFTGLRIEEAFAQLFGPEANFIFRYPRDGSGSRTLPEEVWVLGRARECNARVHARAEPRDYNRPSPGIGQYACQSRIAAEEPSALVAGVDKAETIHHLTAMLEDKEPALRAQALSALTQTGMTEESRWQAVDTALNDEDATVRGAAYQALASDRGSEAMQLLGKALQDPDPGVRIVALAACRT